MARVYSPLAGKMRGRVGSTVFRNGQRATVAAQYNPQVANPKTAAQAVQRAAFATATTAQSALIDIVDHSHEKLTSRRENLQRFVSQNTELVRAGILADYNGAETNIRPVLKGAKTIVPNAYIISEGSLLFPRTQWVSEGSVVGFPLQGTIPETISTDEQYAQALAAIGLLPGDQLSLVAIIRDPSTIVASFEADGDAYYNYACEVVRARITFKSTLPAGFSGSLITNSVFNPELVAKSEGQLLALESEVSDADWLGIASPLADGSQYSMDAAVLIRSQETSSRVAYSNGRMITTSEADFNVAWPMARSYMEGATVRLGAQPFLDNPVTTFVADGSSSAVLNVSVAGIPDAFTAASEPNFEADGIEVMPTSLYLRFAYNGVQQTSPNVVTASEADNLVTYPDMSVVKSGDVSVADSTLSFGLQFGAGNTGSILVLGGYGVLSNGQHFTF